MNLVKIIYLHQYFTTPSMKGGTRSYEFARRLVREGHEVYMITSQRECVSNAKAIWVDTDEDGIQVSWCSIPYSNQMTYQQRISAFVRYAYMSSARASRIKADVVFATSTPLTVAIPAIYCRTRQNIPMVFEVRDLWPEAPIAVGALTNPLIISTARYLERQAYRNSERIVALSPGMKTGIAATGYPESKISVIPNACDIDLFGQCQKAVVSLRARHSWLLDRPMVLYAGTLGKVNGVDYLVRLAALAINIDPDVRFVVVGGGREEDRVRQAATDAKILDRNFFMLPSMSKNDVATWVAAADIATSLVINEPALWKNSANKFFDALAAGVPIAINYGGWQADIIREDGIGLVLDPTNIAKACDSLLRALRDEDWIANARVAAQKVAGERYDRDILSNQLEEVLLDAVSEWQCKKTR